MTKNHADRRYRQKKDGDDSNDANMALTSQNNKTTFILYCKLWLNRLLYRIPPLVCVFIPSDTA